MRIAAIDIGSNAVRLLIEEIFETNSDFHIHKVSLTRVPLRLGEDVFDTGKISREKSLHLVKIMKAFSYLMEVHGIEYFRACATSAMREATNSEEVIKLIRKESEVKIEVISGKEEADLIFSNFSVQKLDPNLNFLYIDVGGGSTEVTLIKGGERIKSKSFALGTVRILQNKVPEKSWSDARAWIEKLTRKEDHLVGMGTGGNINRLHKECGKKTGEPITFGELRSMRDFIEGHEMEDRIIKLKLKPDRADVIVPAANIYLKMMEYASVEEIHVPKLGLSDGMVLQLYHKHKKRK